MLAHPVVPFPFEHNVSALVVRISLDQYVCTIYPTPHDIAETRA